MESRLQKRALEITDKTAQMELLADTMHNNPQLKELIMSFITLVRIDALLLLEARDEIIKLKK